MICADVQDMDGTEAFAAGRPVVAARAMDRTLLGPSLLLGGLLLLIGP